MSGHTSSPGKKSANFVWFTNFIRASHILIVACLISRVMHITVPFEMALIPHGPHIMNSFTTL